MHSDLPPSYPRGVTERREETPAGPPRTDPVGPADEGASVFAAVDATPRIQEVRVDQHA